MHDVRDNARNKHYGPDGTWIGWPYDKYAAPYNSVGERLDNIFVRHATAIKEGVLNLKLHKNLKALMDRSHNDFIKTEYPSDHLPVIADLLFAESITL